MNADEKRRFCGELTRNILDDIIKAVPKMPEEWDGHELRRYIADKFETAVMDGYMTDRRSSRYRQYRNAVLVRGLL